MSERVPNKFVWEPGDVEWIEDKEEGEPETAGEVDDEFEKQKPKDNRNDE